MLMRLALVAQFVDHSKINEDTLTNACNLTNQMAKEDELQRLLFSRFKGWCCSMIDPLAHQALRDYTHGIPDANCSQ
eukprot:1140196-Pelagomonas_calceolata.AAC.3